jgi:hypothetical protein
MRTSACTTPVSSCEAHPGPGGVATCCVDGPRRQRPDASLVNPYNETLENNHFGSLADFSTGCLISIRQWREERPW